MDTHINLNDKRILVTGGTGMVGMNLKKFLRNAWYPTRSEMNLMDERSVVDGIRRYNPDVVIHLAAKVGGIVANSKDNYWFLYDNLMINQNLITGCLGTKNVKLVALSSSCVYPPNKSGIPHTEEEIFNGLPEITNLGYAWAKRTMTVQMQLAHEQFGLNGLVLAPTNLYGPHDHFDAKRGHLIPAVIKRMSEYPCTLELFGTGRAQRQFMYIDDFVKMMLKAIELNLQGFYNVTDGQSYTVEEIVYTIAQIMLFAGKIEFTGQLEGVFNKDVSGEKLQEAGVSLEKYTELYWGITKTYEFYEESMAANDA